MKSHTYFLGVVSSEEVPLEASPSAPVGPYYADDSSQYYPDYGQAYPSQPSFTSPLDRQGLETAIAAPIIITAFAAALLGGIVSPMFSRALSRLGEYTIEWPQVKRKVPTSDEGLQKIDTLPVKNFSLQIQMLKK